MKISLGERRVGAGNEAGLRRWIVRLGWMALGATLFAITMFFRSEKSELTELQPLEKSSTERHGFTSATRQTSIGRRTESAVHTVADRRRSLGDILKVGGPVSRVEDRVADWSLHATADDLLTALEGVDGWPELSPEVEPVVVDRLINRLAQLDGAAAADMARALKSGGGAGRDYLGTAYSCWLSEQPRQAIAHILEHESTGRDTDFNYLTQMLQEVGEADGRLAAEVAEKMVWSGNAIQAEAATARRADLFAAALETDSTLQFLNEWVAAGRFTAKEIEGFREQLVRSAVSYGSGPERLAALMDQGLSVDEDLRWEAMRVLGKGDPARANQFLLGQADPEKRVEELTALFDAQAELGAEGLAMQRQTTEWLAAGYQGADRQTLLMEASKKLMDEDLGLAWRAASAMQDDSLKFASTYAVGFDWLSKDPATARARLPRELVERYDLIHALYSEAVTGFPADVKLQLSFSR